MEIVERYWDGNRVRFVYHNNEWWAVLKDICDALDLKVAQVSMRLDPDNLDKVRIGEVGLTNVSSGRNGVRHSQMMTIVDEYGIYETLFASRKLEARKFRKWNRVILKKLRTLAGLEGYDILHMCDDDVQEWLTGVVDGIEYDEASGHYGFTRVIAGGDVVFEYMDDI